MGKTQHYTFGQCTAAAKSTGKQCTRPAMQNGKCPAHGGATPSGTESANWIHGIYSEALKRAKRSGFMEKYQRVLNDENLLSLNDEIALTKARISELLEDVGEVPDFDTLDNLWRAGRDAYQAQNEERHITLYNALGEAINAGKMQQQNRKELREESDTLRKLNMAEQQRRTKMAEYIQAEHVITILARLGAMINGAASIEQLRTEALEFIWELIGPHTRADYVSGDITTERIAK